MLAELLSRYKLIFWDFDGVIKNSVKVKTDAFISLFRSFGAEIVERVRAHHEMNGGMYRYEKIPIYLGWAGLSPDSQLVDDYCKRFSLLVVQKVVDASWVTGVENYPCYNPYQQKFVLVSATPQDEIEKY
ncbi:MAG: hypothetical protein RBT37_00530 [Dissulfurispiraceae bacterium]|jgi:beta-phosphoglucomutase-like phosphatase (HAD superfamily)|nr:hypothetical protein [Dissulfurispiraceae bacterium]